MKNRLIILLLSACVLFTITSWAVHHLGIRPVDVSMVAVEASAKISELQSEASRMLVRLEEDDAFLQDPFGSAVSGELAGMQESGIHFFLYQEGGVRFWSSNKVPLPYILPGYEGLKGLQWIGNGWYLPVIRHQGGRELIALIEIANEYPFQNQYLSNAFNPRLSIPHSLVLNPDRGESNIIDADGNFLFSLNSGQEPVIRNGLENLSVLLAMIAYVFLLLLLYRAHLRINPLPRYPGFSLLAYIIDALILRLLLHYLSVPGFLYEASFFQPYLFSAGPLFSSPGDLTLNIITFLGIAIPLSLRSRIPSGDAAPGTPAFLLPMLGFFLSLIAMYFAVGVTESIFLHSDIPLNLSNLFSFTSLSFLFLLLVSLVYTGALLSAGALINRFILPWRRAPVAWAGILLAIIAFLLFSGLGSVNAYLALAIVFLALLISFISQRWSAGTFSFLSVLLSVVLVSLACTFQHNQLNTSKEHQQRILLADVLSQEQDPVSEYLFKEIVKSMDKDHKLYALINADTLDDDIITRYILAEYFRKDPHWERYNFQLTICSPFQQLIIESDISPEYSNVNCDSFFDGLIMGLGRMTLSRDLFSIDYGTGQDSYLGILRFPRRTDGMEQVLSIYIEFTSKDIRSDLGFPSLLSDNTGHDIAPFIYSYAYYKSGSLSNSYGKFTYNIDLQNYGDSLVNLDFFEASDFHHNYDHLCHYIDADRVLLLSREKPGLLETISPVSYFFLIFMFIFGLISILYMGSDRRLRSSPSFRSRLQFTLISIIIISFVSVGLASFSYLRNLNRQKNFDILTEKAHSVLIEIEHKLSDVKGLNPEISPYLTKILTKFSRVFFTDINLFDLNGSLLASSRTQIFDEQLISTQMHPEAFTMMSVDKRSLFIHREEIGGLEYLSAYVPFRNENDELVAFLNLPYFIKEQELKSEITAFLVAYINIYALLIALAIIMALFFSNLITRPLRLIRDSLRKVSFDSSNARIDMDRNDEIGELVNEYNRMVDELGHSAELLAASERQSAWREMAKQVAHEIKNPLTPMKLSVQYLEKAWNDKDPDWESRLKRFTSTVIEQIESLSQIATEFSDFAKMPESRKEKVFLEHILTSSAEFFGDIDQTELLFSYDPSATYPVYADKKQLLRAFNNLIKNARQAVELKEHGRIDIRLFTVGTEHRVEISDNGHGIDPAQAEQIFSPNFTTRSGGMGLGLAIVKSIIEESSGKVSFTSDTGLGATFIVTLPHYTEPKTS